MLGERIRQARQEKGLSQRQLCGKEITRNMLSLIENGSARPSMETLQYLARQLEKPVSWFLDEQVPVSPNLGVMADARAAFAQKEYADAAKALEGFQGPDDTFEGEYRLLYALSLMGWAEQVLEKGKSLFAADLLEKAKEVGEGSAYFGEEQGRRWLLLMGRTGRIAPQTLALQLSSCDEELLLRAEAARAAGDAKRAVSLLEAVEDRGSRWQLLRGRAEMALGEYAAAAEHFRNAEPTYPKECCEALERCYRELEDYKRAYEYACKRRAL